MRVVFIVVLLSALTGARLHAEPGPGDIFKEFSWHRSGGKQDIIVAGPAICTHSGCPSSARNYTNTLTLDLNKAVRAEVVVEHWSGHKGTSGRGIRFNGNAAISVPMIQGVGSPECYHAMHTRTAVPVPLKQLVHGSNNFTYTVNKQLCGKPASNQYPAWGVWGVIVRVYYDNTKPHASGSITKPVANSVIGDSVDVKASVSGDVDRVELVADYEDFDWEGNGVFRQWHYRYWYNVIGRHLGTATTSPYRVSWDTRVVPDQSSPMRIAARIVASDGTITFTKAVGGLTFSRPRSVKMYRCNDVPQTFDSRVSKPKVCTIKINDNLAGAKAAQLVVPASEPHEDTGELGLNSKKLIDVPVGITARPSHTFFTAKVPLSLLTKDNTFYVNSPTNHHALEVLWPGPALLVTYPGKVVPPSDAGTPDIMTPDAGVPASEAGSIPLDVGAVAEMGGAPDLGIPDQSDIVNNPGVTSEPTAEQRNDTLEGGCALARGNGLGFLAIFVLLLRLQRREKQQRSSSQNRPR